MTTGEIIFILCGLALSVCAIWMIIAIVGLSNDHKHGGE